MRFDGATYDHDRDRVRLTAQLRRIFLIVTDGEWHTLREISHKTGDPEPSVSTRLRDFRKPRFGGWTVDRRYVSNGLHEYRLRPPGSEPYVDGGNEEEEELDSGEAN